MRINIPDELNRTDRARLMRALAGAMESRDKGRSIEPLDRFEIKHPSAKACRRRAGRRVAA